MNDTEMLRKEATAIFKEFYLKKIASYLLASSIIARKQ